MPKDEKKMWVVRDWVSGSNARQNYESVLNELYATGYDVFEIDHDKCWVTAYLRDGARRETPRELPGNVGSLVEVIMGRIRPPKEAEKPREEPEVDEASRVMNAYSTKGTMTDALVDGLRTVTVRAGLGDPYVDEHLTNLVRSLFDGAPMEEARRSLQDVQFFRDHHRKYLCKNDSCSSHKILESTIEKLTKLLMANPAS